MQRRIVRFKAYVKRRLDPRSLRLACTYLAIIMTMSVGFSSIFYGTSVNQLPVQSRMSSADIPEDDSKTPPSSMGNISFGGKNIRATGTVDEINRQIQQYIVQAQLDLFRQLVLLNGGALVIGSVLSYYLARKTLRPIEAAMEMQSRFASDASHELRTPLTIIQTEIDVVLRGSNLTLKRAKQALRNNREEVAKLKELSEGLLRLTQTSKHKLVFMPVALDEVVSEAMNRIVKPAQAKRITIVDVVPQLFSRGDFQSLIQALVIILDNAVKYSASGRRVFIEARVDGKSVYLDVRDEGPGIRASDLPHIFERFYRADTSRSNKDVSGYGLGLSIAKKIIDQHGGAITVVSTLGHGTTFTIKLPL